MSMGVWHPGLFHKKFVIFQLLLFLLSPGFPYADCFMVEVRHVVSRVGDNDLSIQIGLFVNFVKKTMFESKIKVCMGNFISCLS